MQPTARAALLAHARHARPTHQQQQQHAPHQQQSSAAGGTAAATAARQQWDARLASFQRGLDHVMRCDAGDACGSSLCHATKRLMRSYATHDCTNPPGTSTTTTTNHTECKVCKLWGYILAKHKATKTATASRGAAPPRVWHSPTLGVSPPPSGLPPVLPPLSCGLAHARAQHGGIGGIGVIGAIGGARDARDARGGVLSAPRRRAVVTPELIKILAKRV